MGSLPQIPLRLSASVRKELEQRARSQRIERRYAERARIVIYRIEGLTQKAIAQKLECSEARVAKWLSRFRGHGLDGLNDKVGRGRKPELKPEIIEKILAIHQRPPDASKRWTVKKMSEFAEVSPSTVHKLWKQHGIDPRQSARTTEFSRDPSLTPVRKHQRSRTTRAANFANLHSVAEKAQVSAMTVSRVLNNHPNVRPRIRERVNRAIEDCGYRPDPQLRKLMLHLRKRKESAFRGSICSLEATWNPKEDGQYVHSLLNGAKAKAHELGFAWESFSMEEFQAKPKRLAQILHARGVEGILLSPTINSDSLPPDAGWEGFSVVAATHSIPNPIFRRAVPAHYNNMFQLCSELNRRGYHRIGLVIPLHGDNRVHHHFSGAFAAFHFSNKFQMIPPLLYRSRRESEMRKWFRAERPDALIVHSGLVAPIIAEHLGLKIPGPVAIASASEPNDIWSGISEYPEMIGATAIEMLCGMILRGETGLPQRPSATMIDGVWKEGISVPDKNASEDFKQ